MKILVCLTALAIVTGVQAGGKSPAAKESSPKSSGFSLLPKSLQKNRKLNCNILTEMTPAGRQVPVPSEEKPIYYILQPGYYQSLGEPAPTNLKPPPFEEIQRSVQSTLAAAGYVEAGKDHSPTVVIVFNYGDHLANSVEVEDTSDANDAQMAYQQAVNERDSLEASMESGSRQKGQAPDKLPAIEAPVTNTAALNTPEELLPFVLSDPRRFRQLIERATIVGGYAFAQELSKALKDEAKSRVAGNANARGAERLAAEAERQRVMNAGNGISDNLDTRMTGNFDLSIASPFHRYYHRDDRTAYLVDEAFGSCYFVIMSAFDGLGIATGEKRLLWRTKMSVDATGVGMRDTLSTLIGAASPYFGRETAGTVVVPCRAP